MSTFHFVETVYAITYFSTAGLYWGPGF